VGGIIASAYCQRKASSVHEMAACAPFCMHASQRRCRSCRAAAQRPGAPAAAGILKQRSAASTSTAHTLRRNLRFHVTFQTPTFPAFPPPFRTHLPTASSPPQPQPCLAPPPPPHRRCRSWVRRLKTRRSTSVRSWYVGSDCSDRGRMEGRLHTRGWRTGRHRCFAQTRPLTVAPIAPALLPRVFVLALPFTCLVLC